MVARKTLLQLIIICATALSMNAAGLSFGSENLRKAAAALSIDTLQWSDANTVIVRKGMPLTFRVSEGKVEHIGWHIFSFAQREAMPSPVYDYVEWACLDNKMKLTENPFVYKNFVIEKGSWESLTTLNDTMPCSVTRMENAFYRVEWQREDGSEVAVRFPIGYERLYMMSRREIEQKFLDEVVQFPDAVVAEQGPTADSLLTADGDLLVEAGEHYILPQVNRNMYFRRDSTYGVVLVYDKEFPVQSVANMMVSGDKWLTAYPLELSVTTYDREVVTLNMTLRQLLGYAQKKGCVAYWGYDSTEDGVLKGTLFLYNPAYGYDHVVRVTCDIDSVGTKDLVLKAQAMLFSPTTNIKTLFGDGKGKSKPKKIN